VPLLRCKSRDELMKPGVTIAIVVVALGIAFRVFCGLYSVQPIGAAPEGMTAIVWRSEGEPFFNSADGLCLDRAGSVSLMCRAMALGQAPVDRIIVRLPYQAWAYHASTGGLEFDR
jgi:hypothetical protein